MDHSLQLQLTDRLLAHLDQQTTDTSAQLVRMPASHYAGEDQLAREREILFNGMPRFVGLSGLLPKPGDYCCDDNYGTPLVLVRDVNNQFRAFRNACRHRGTRIAEGRGHSGNRFTCPYHGWTYTSTGQLMPPPSQQHFDGLDISACNLAEVPAVEHNGMLWVGVETDHAGERSGPHPGNALSGAGINRFLHGLDDELASYQPGHYHLYKNRELQLQMNWKLAIDTFLEPYHFPVLHRKTVDAVFFPNLCLFDAFGPHLREVLARRSITHQREQPRSEWNLVSHSAIVYVLFPNTVVVVQIDHLEIWRAFPDPADPTDPNRCRMLLDFYIPEPAASEKAVRHWEANLDLTVRTVLEEDFPAATGAQRGFRAAGAPELIFGRNEPALAHFESTVARHLS